MTGKAKVIGSSTPEENAVRFPLLAKQLPQAMGELNQTDNISVGASSLGQMIQARENRYAFTRDLDFRPPDGLEGKIFITDYVELVNRYKDSAEEPLVVGGATILKLFLSFATSLDAAMGDQLVPGDVVCEGWDNGYYEIARPRRWEAFTIVYDIRVD